MIREMPSSRSRSLFDLGPIRSVGLRLNGSSDPLNMESTVWPSGLRGLFVGISSMFYAAQAAGIDGKLIRKKFALSAFAQAIEQELHAEFPAEQPGPVIQAHQRKLASLAMAHALVSHVLHDDAWLYFRRTWQTPDQRAFVATWSLGVFLSGRRQSNIGDAIISKFTKAEEDVDEIDENSMMDQQSSFLRRSGSYEGEAVGNWRRRLAAVMSVNKLRQRTPGSGSD